jgi:hypothetical protein
MNWTCLRHDAVLLRGDDCPSCAAEPKPDKAAEERDLAASQVMALDAIREHLVAALGGVGLIDPESAVPQLLDARRAIRQAIGFIDVFEDQVVEKQRRLA